MSTRFNDPAPRFFSNSMPSAPLSGGKLFFYVPGTTTLKNTFKDANLSIPNTNPVILSASGQVPNIFLSGSYRAILQDKDGFQIFDRDNLNSTAQIPFTAWDSTFSYSIGGQNIVFASDSKYYVSLVNNNIGNNPVSSPGEWRNLADRFLADQISIPIGNVAVGSTGDGLVGLPLSGNNGRLLTEDDTAPLGVAWAIPPDAIRDYQEFTSSDDWTKPDDVTFVLAQLIAGGGGGANANANNAGGGAGGEYVEALFLASDLHGTVSVTIGAGGDGGAAGSSNDGSIGGDTTFGSHLTAKGGRPGRDEINGGAGGTTGSTKTSLVGGASSNFGVLVQQLFGSHGAPMNGQAGDTVFGGAGGAGGGSSTAGVSQLAGNGGATNGNGVAPGGGGGGSSTDAGGGDGAPGRARIWSW